MAAGRDQDVTRAMKTLYVSGFDQRLMTKELLEELFVQGGPVTDVKLLDNHAYVQFEDMESVSYCLALFNDIEIHGRKLRVNAKKKSKYTSHHLKYLSKVRETLRDQYAKVPPPKLPPKEHRFRPATKSNHRSKR